MTSLREAWARLLSFFRKQELDRDFDEELAAHIDLASDDFIRQGLSPSEARRQALIQLGGVEPSKEAHRDTRGLPWLDGVVQDVRYAGRSLRRSPGFTAVAVGMLALGIGMNALVFTVTNAVLFKGFPLVAENDRLLYLTEGSGCCVSYPNFLDWQAQAKSFEAMALVHGKQQTYTDDGSGFPETFYTTEITANTFEVVGQKPFIGRDFTPDDELPGAPPVAILRYGFWERRYAKDPSILGQTVMVSGIATTVVGVMPQGFSFPQNQDLWVPIIPTPAVMQRDNRNTWFAVGRLADGVSEEAARTEMATIFGRLRQAYPQVNNGPQQRETVYRFHEFFIGPNATAIYQALFGAVAFVLLIACANLANLLLARSMSRSRETSLRIALGAGRWRIIRQLLVESLMLSAMGGLMGYVIARWGIGIYAAVANGVGASDALNGTWFDNMFDYSMDARVVAYLAAISIGTGLLFGLAPALKLLKTDINASLQEGGRGATSGERSKRLSGLLVVAEIALAVVLLAGAGVMVRSFLRIYTAELGFEPQHIVTSLLNPGRDRPQATREFFSQLTPRLAAVPGIESVAVTSSNPGAGSRQTPYELDGPTDGDNLGGEQRPLLSMVQVSPRYFETIGVGLLSGRDFRENEGADASPVIVSQLFAANHWPQQEALGKRLRFYQGDAPGEWRTVVGVVANVAQGNALDPASNAVVYAPLEDEQLLGFWVLARTQAPLGDFTAELRREIYAIDPLQPIILGPFALDQMRAERYQYRGVTGIMFLLCAAIALLLATVGLYAVIAYSITQRTQEIGVRMALGGTPGDIRNLVLKQGIWQVGIGLTIGLCASLGVNRLFEAQLVDVGPTDPTTLVVTSVLLILAALLGCLIPGHRATRIDPLTALRHE